MFATGNATVSGLAPPRPRSLPVSSLQPEWSVPCSARCPDDLVTLRTGNLCPLWKSTEQGPRPHHGLVPTRELCPLRCGGPAD